MYHALLTNRYLTTRVIPFIAVAAVALCTALVIIVVSVMSGFVDMVRSAGKTLMGDVIIAYPIHGLPHYERLMTEIAKLPDVEGVSPVVDSWGLMKMPYEETEVVQVWGIEPQSFDTVTGYFDHLYWKPIEDDDLWVASVENAARERWTGLVDAVGEQNLDDILSLTRDPVMAALVEWAPAENRQKILELPQREWRERLPPLLGDAWLDVLFREPSLRDDPNLRLSLGRVLQQGKTLEVEGRPAVVAGIHVSQANERRRDTTYRVIGGGSLWLPAKEVTLTVLPIKPGNQVSDPKSRIFPVANEAQFGVYQIDDNRVLIPIDVLQEMLELDQQDIIDPNEIDLDTGTPRVIGVSPKKATLVLVSGREGVDPNALKKQVEGVYDTLRETLAGEDHDEILPPRNPGTSIKTWEEQNAQFIGPVEKERNLMRILFSIVYFVCAGLVLVIFWAIVYEKTRDIGILRSIGASRLGILWIFVRYGLVVGVVGSIIGLGLAWIVVHYINTIHNLLGEPFPVWAWSGVFAVATACLVATVWRLMKESILPVIAFSLLTITLIGMGAAMALHQGFLVWDPKIYYFAEIPNHVDTGSAIVTMVGAVVFSMIGALIPAARAGDIDPVSALRYE